MLSWQRGYVVSADGPPCPEARVMGNAAEHPVPGDLLPGCLCSGDLASGGFCADLWTLARPPVFLS